MFSSKCPEIGEWVQVRRREIGAINLAWFLYEGRITQYGRYQGTFWLKVEKVNGEPIPAGSYPLPMVCSFLDIDDIVGEKELLKIEINDLMKRTAYLVSA